MSNDTRELPSGLRVLVVDDNRDAADTLADVLRSAGCDVTTAYDGMAALDRIRQQTPQVVVMDIGMPKMSGYDVARAAAALPSKPFLIALTGWGQESDRAAALGAGFNRHFTKPVQPEALIQLLAELASGAPPVSAPPVSAP